MNKKYFSLLVLPFLLANANVADAAGYELLEQSSNGVGQAFAGASTGFGDGSEVFFNPAAMTNLPKNTFSADVHFIMPHAEFSNEGSAYAPQAGGQILEGNQGGDAGSLALVPNLYAVWKSGNSVAFGLGVNSPYGLTSDYNDTWVGRYHAIKSELTSVNLNPAVAVQLSDSVSIGTSMQIIYADAELSNAIDFGSIGAATLGLEQAAALGMRPQQSDGFVKVDGNDWGVGMGLGGVYKPSDSIKLGVNWRSKVNINLDGDADFTLPNSALALTSTGLFQDSDAQAKLELPEEIRFGIADQLNSDWSVFADGTWVKWSRFEQLNVTFDSAQPDSTQIEDWDNTWRGSIGTNYRMGDWILRSGFTYDQSPVPDREHRTPRIPDNDRYWLAAGASYALSDKSSVGFNYAHLFVPSADSQLVNSTGAVLNGNWDLGIDIASVNYISQF